MILSTVFILFILLINGFLNLPKTLWTPFIIKTIYKQSIFNIYLFVVLQIEPTLFFQTSEGSI